MSNDLITTADYETAPEDHAEAFVYLVRLAHGRLLDDLGLIHPEAEREYDAIL